MNRYEKCMLVLVGGIVAILFTSVTLIILGHDDAAWFMSYVGTFLWMMAVFLWVVVWDSRSRWPHAGMVQRAANVITFKRGSDA